jgi:hypothetical protein
VEDVEDAWRKCGGYFFGLLLINKEGGGSGGYSLYIL